MQKKKAINNYYISYNKNSLIKEVKKVNMHVHGWHLPSDDTYFKNVLDDAVRNGLPPEYQLPHRLAALKAVEKFGVALDVGAHLGFWSRHLAKEFKIVHSFEPSKNYISLLKLNAPDVIIHDFALGEKEGLGELFLPNVNSGAAFIAHNASGHKKINIKTLDSLNIENIDFIKLDCEGYEYPVILGGTNTITRCRPVMCLEQKKGVGGRYDHNQYQYRALEYLIEKLNYKVVDRVVDDWVLKTC